jgi:hypothetical protein
MRAAKPKAKGATEMVWTGNRRPMRHSDFRIGCEFLTPTGRWRCTDIGTRTIVAIKLDVDHDTTWYHGPPYAVVESVFDEDDIETCEPAPPRRSYDDSGRAGIILLRRIKTVRKRSES